MKPLICIPMGDPAGIGPEIIVKAIASKDFSQHCRLLVVGSYPILQRATQICNLPLDIIPISHTSQLSDKPCSVNLFQPAMNGRLVAFGEVSATAGEMAYQSIDAAVSMALSNQVDAISTPPINKQSLRAAGIDHIGHTEILASLTRVNSPLTLFQVEKLRVFFLSRHLSLKAACDYVTRDNIYHCSIKAIEALKLLGESTPHLAVAGLNPHCGEEGQFGHEEIQEITPAIQQLRQEGYQVSGPLPADSVFHQALQGDFDAVLSLYHDQGHIATKMVDFERTISITCGLPFLRTSVDHGTAFDIAGTGMASEVCMVEAILLAAQYGRNFSASTAH